MGSWIVKPYWGMRVASGRLRERGSILLSVIGMMIVLLISGLFIHNYVQNLFGSTKKLTGDIYYRLALNSLMDYTLTGIRMKWCFSSSWISSPSCDLLNNGSVERMLLSPKAIIALSTTTMPMAAPLLLTSISESVNISAAITAAHPLYTITHDLGGIDHIDFSIVRINDKYLSSMGNEVPLRVTISLVPSLATMKTYTLESQVIVTPRELNYFGLVIANDLDLSSPSHAATTFGSANAGDVKIAKTSAAGPNGDLIFSSPVFINGNLILPTTPGSYAPVTFLDKIHMAGNIMKASTPYSPPHPGGVGSTYWRELTNLGGLMKGVELDAGPDNGLWTWVGKTASMSLSASQVDLCRARRLAKADLSQTSASPAYLKVTSMTHAGPSFNLNASLSLGSLNFFNEQVISSPTLSGTGALTPQLTGGGGDYVMRLAVEIQGYGGNLVNNIFADVSRNQSFEINLGSAGNPVPLKVTLSDNIVGGLVQSDQINLAVHYNATNLTDFQLSNYVVGSATTPARVIIRFIPFDVGFDRGHQRRHWGLMKENSLVFDLLTAPAGKLELNKASTVPIPMVTWAVDPYLQNTTSPVSYPTALVASLDHPVPATDWVTFDNQCIGSNPLTNQPNPSFTVPDWSAVNFTPFTKESWQINGDWDYDVTTGDDIDPGASTSGFRQVAVQGPYVFDASNSPLLGQKPSSFRARSRVEKCVIKSTAQLVTGFFFCDVLEIQARTMPLRIIGTFVVGAMDIDPTAIQAGIQWSSIWNYQAILELRDAGILTSNAVCNGVAKPIWLPNLSVVDHETFLHCGPSVLREKMDAFRWTLVDPDCGYSSALQLKPTCQNRVQRYVIQEVTRSEL